MRNFSKIYPLLWLVLLLAVFQPHDARAGLIVQHPNYFGLNQGLVGYWSFDGQEMVATSTGSAALDTSGNGNTGYLHNGPQTTLGKTGQALKFDGVNDYVNVAQGSGAADHLNLTNNLTISAWVKLAVAGYRNQGSDHNIFMQRGAWNDNTNYGFGYASDNKPQFTYRTYLATWGTAINDNTWHHLVGVRRGTVLEIWVDGVKGTDGSTCCDANLNTGESFYIGADQNSNRYSNSSIDDVRIYNRALNEDEIKRLYRIGGALKLGTSRANSSLSQGLVGWWTFDGKDINGTKAADASGNGNIGTLINGPTPAIGKLGQALSFDGVNDYVTMNNANGIFGDTGSIAFWVKSTTDADARMWRLEDVTLTGMTIEIGNGAAAVLTNELITIFWNPNGTRVGYTTTNRNELFDGNWHHIAITADNVSYKIYLDGISKTVTVGSGSNSGQWPKADGGSFYHSISDTKFLNGTLDDVRIYNRALNSDEIKRLYRMGAAFKIGTPQATDSLKNGLVGWWTFDGQDMPSSPNNMFALDRSGQGNTGKLKNMATSSAKTEGILGQALKFDGSSYVQAGQVLPKTGPMSISMWVNPSSAAAIDQLLSWAVYGDRAMYFKKTYFEFDFCVGSNCVSGSSQYYSIHTLQLNVWQHVVATWDGTNSSNSVHLYLNGVNDDDGSPSIVSGSVTNDTGGNTYIAGNPGAGKTFVGSMDDVRFYNRVLNQDEIKRLYEMGAAR